MTRETKYSQNLPLSLVIEEDRSFIRGGGWKTPGESVVAERKTKVDYMGKMVDGHEVMVEESVDRWSDVKLSDGSVLRVKLSILGAIRVDGEFDPDGNPTYVLKLAPQMLVSEAPDNLRILADAWDKEAGVSSSTGEIVMCPSYQKIIGMGEKVLPFIFRQLEKERKQPNNWFWALRAITGADPVLAEDRGNRPKMATAWLRWGRKRYAW